MVVLLLRLGAPAKGIERILSSYSWALIHLLRLLILLLTTVALVVTSLELIMLRHAPELLLLGLTTVSWHSCTVLLLHASALIVIRVSHLILNSIYHLIIHLLLLRLHLAHKNWVWNKFWLLRCSLLSLRLLWIIVWKRIERCILIISTCWCTSAKIKSIILICILSILSILCNLRISILRCCQILLFLLNLMILLF